MPKRIILLAVFIVFAQLLRAQPIFEIKIETATKATFIARNGATAADFKQLDFSTGTGKFVITNLTTTEKYKITVVTGPGDQLYAIPAAKIPKATTEGTAVSQGFDVKNDGEVTDVPNGLLDPKLKIKVTVEDAAGKVLGTFEQAGAAIPPRNNVSNTKPGSQEAMRQYVEDQIEEKGYRYVSSQNIIIDRAGVIHIYLDENLSPVYSYFPTMAKEGYDKFMFHILSTDNYNYTIESNGRFVERPLSDDISSGSFPVIQSGGAKIKVHEYPSAIFGPYSSNFPFLIQRYKAGVADLSLDKSVKLLKVNRVSLDVGIVASWLRNPENIAKFGMPSGDTTLVADNPNVKGLMVAMLTFHFKPRNLTIPPRSFNERLGMSFGVGLSEKVGKNFFFGLNIELVNGLFINGGAHFGEINYPVNHKDFKFGTEKFTGLLLTKKRWDVQPYASISIDAALFIKAFSSLFGGTAGPAAGK